VSVAQPPLQRIVMVAHSHLLGGIERHVVALSASLAQAGHAVAYAGPLDGWMGEQMQAAGYECVHVPMHGMFDAFSAWRLARFAKRWGASVLHGHAQRGGRYADWAARWSGVPAVVTAHSTNAFRWMRPRMRILAVSGAVRSMLLAQGMPPGQVQVVYSGVPDPGAPAPYRSGSVNESAPLHLGLVGRLEPVKGLDIALQALVLLRRQAEFAGRCFVRLDVIGPDDTPWAQQMREQVQALGLGSQVQFLGSRSDVAQLLSQMDAVIAPSRREALPLALMEACAAGRPALAARVGGVPEIVEDQVSGLLVAPEDPVALAQAMGQLLRQPELVQIWGQAARQRYEQHFTLASMLQGVVGQYLAAQSPNA
jgi:glycosyltransferase involved in cell wall biosynthesis